MPPARVARLSDGRSGAAVVLRRRGGGGNSGYRPDQPIVLESFYPKTGSIATQVIIEGRNFGTDAKALNVYFNEKRAAVISSTGNRMLVLAPKLPGEECVISVSMGENEEN